MWRVKLSFRLKTFPHILQVTLLLSSCVGMCLFNLDNPPKHFLHTTHRKFVLCVVLICSLRALRELKCFVQWWQSMPPQSFSCWVFLFFSAKSFPHFSQGKEAEEEGKQAAVPELSEPLGLVRTIPAWAKISALLVVIFKISYIAFFTLTDSTDWHWKQCFCLPTVYL